MSLQRSPRISVGQAQKKDRREKKNLLQEILNFAWMLLAVAAAVLLLQAYVAQPIRIDGTSMESTLHDGEFVLVSKFSRWLGGDLRRGDVVICRYPGRIEQEFYLGAAFGLTQHTIFVKRLVALPGDTVEIRNGSLYVNGEKTDDPPYMASTPRDYSLRALGENEYFVIGDNRFTSHDSRANDVGPIGKEGLMGKVECVLWPLNKIRGVK